LNELKNSYLEQYNNSINQTDKNRFDFKKFLINTFVNTQNISTSSSNIVEEKVQIEEDALTKNFKRNKLF